MVSDVDPAGTIAVSWPSRPPLPQDTLRGGSGQRPVRAALAAWELAVLEGVESPLEVRTQPLASAVGDTPRRPPPPLTRPINELLCGARTKEEATCRCGSQPGR